MPIRVVTKEVRYIHELSLTLEHSMSISSPAVPGLTEELTGGTRPTVTERDREVEMGQGKIGPMCWAAQEIKEGEKKKDRGDLAGPKLR